MMRSDDDSYKNTEQPSPASMLAEVVVMSKDMLVQAESGCWENVTSMEAERRQLLEKCFAMPIDEGQSNLVSEALAAMLHMNEELIGLLENAKANVAIKRTKQRYTNKSLVCYSDFDGDS